MHFSEIIKLQFVKKCHVLFVLKLCRGICYLMSLKNASSYFQFFISFFVIAIALVKICLSLMVPGHKQLKNTPVLGGTILKVEVSQMLWC